MLCDCLNEEAIKVPYMFSNISRPHSAKQQGELTG